MIWLLDSDRALVSVLPDYDSLITTRRFTKHGEWTARVPASKHADLLASTYATTDEDDTCWLVENVELVTSGLESYCTVSGREATALLELRTIEGTQRFTADKPGAIVSALIATLTGGRAIPGLAFGTGDTLGAAVDVQRSWGTMADAAWYVCNAGGVGMRARLSGTDILIDVYDTAVADAFLGDAYGNAAASTRATRRSEWRNYAIVLGEDVFETMVPDAASAVVGTVASGTFADMADSNGTPMVWAEVAGQGLTAQVEFTPTAGCFPDHLRIYGYYSGTTGHWVGIQVRDSAGTYQTIESLFMASGGQLSDQHEISVPSDYVFGGKVYVRLVHNVATYNSAHRLYIDHAELTCTAQRVRVDVDATAGAPRRELYVDARDLQRGDLSEAVYESMLEQRGLEKLAETRLIESVDATSTTRLDPGDVTWYDSGAFSDWFTITEATRIKERGTIRYEATLGDKSLTLKDTLRKVTT